MNKSQKYPDMQSLYNSNDSNNQYASGEDSFAQEMERIRIKRDKTRKTQIDLSEDYDALLEHTEALLSLISDKRLCIRHLEDSYLHESRFDRLPISHNWSQIDPSLQELFEHGFEFMDNLKSAALNRSLFDSSINEMELSFLIKLLKNIKNELLENLHISNRNHKKRQENTYLNNRQIKSDRESYYKL